MKNVTIFSLMSSGENNVRIAMWSGPRNLSTALMRSFSSRPDSVVLDEPFYAFYLQQTGIRHPGREQITAAYETRWERVIDSITGPVPDEKCVWYQKHMAHHMLPPMRSERLVDSGKLTHAFLIRDPAAVIGSYIKVHSDMTIAETGLPYQVDLFNLVSKATGKIPPVVDAEDILINPRRTLSSLCDALQISFTPSMLSWPAGPHPNDGKWAPYWYESVYESTAFERHAPKNQALPTHLKPMLAQAQYFYDQLAEHKI